MAWMYLPEDLENYHSSLERAEACLDRLCSDGKQSAMSKTTPIASKSSRPVSEMDTYMTHPFGTMLGHSTGIPGLDRWILSLRDSPASRSVLQESGKEQTTTATCGQKPSGLFGKCDPVMRCVKTCQGLLAGIMDTSDEYLATFPKAGMMLDGELYRRPTWERPISEKGSGYWRTPASSDGEGGIMEMREGKTGHYKLRDHVQEINKNQWPTPSAQPPGWKNIEVVDRNGNMPEYPNQRFYDKDTGRLVQKGLEQVAQMWPTPRAGLPGSRKLGTGGKVLAEEVKFPTPTAMTGNNSGRLDEWGGSGNPYKGTEQGKQQLNPDWVEWLMGFPRGWTSLEVLEDMIWTEWETDPADTWECPRVISGTANRIDRLKALGNAQVSACVVMAWTLLYDERGIKN